MKTGQLFIVLSIFSLLVMLGVDYLLGARAEFLNAWSVVQRLLGQVSAGESVVYRSVGALGEFVSVILVNLFTGGLLTYLFRSWVTTKQP